MVAAETAEFIGQRLFMLLVVIAGMYEGKKFWNNRNKKKESLNHPSKLCEEKICQQ